MRVKVGMLIVRSYTGITQSRFFNVLRDAHSRYSGLHKVEARRSLRRHFCFEQGEIVAGVRWLEQAHCRSRRGERGAYIIGETVKRSYTERSEQRCW